MSYLRYDNTIPLNYQLYTHIALWLHLHKIGNESQCWDVRVIRARYKSPHFCAGSTDSSGVAGMDRAMVFRICLSFI